jgi:hypothetical protein
MPFARVLNVMNVQAAINQGSAPPFRSVIPSASTAFRSDQNDNTSKQARNGSGITR